MTRAATLTVAICVVLSTSPVLTLGCGGPCNEGASPPQLILGTANRDGSGFIPINAGDTLELVAGGQGGHHVWLNFRVAGICPERAEITRNVYLRDLGGEPLGQQWGILTLSPSPTEPGFFELQVAVPYFACPNNFGYDLDGVDCDLEVLAEESAEVGNEMLEAATEFRMACEPGDALCANQCGGI